MRARRGYCTTALYVRYVPHVKLHYRAKLARFNSVLRSRGVDSSSGAHLFPTCPLIPEVIASRYISLRAITGFDVTNRECRSSK